PDDVAGNQPYYRIEKHERRRCSHNDREPGPTAKHDDNGAYRHRGGSGKEATIPSVLGERASNKGRSRKSDQITTSGTHQIKKSEVSLLEERQTACSFDQIGDHRQGAETRSQQRAREQNCERLSGNRN